MNIEKRDYMIKKRYMVSYMYSKLTGLCYAHISVSAYGKLSNDKISELITPELPSPSTKFIVTNIAEICENKCEIDNDFSI